MLTLLHISDLHFGPPFVPRVGAALLRIAPKLNADVLVVSGDLTQRAKRGEFQEARAFLDQLPRLPQIIVPGNHDVPLYRISERMFTPHGMYQEYIDSQLDRVWRFDQAVIAALDSTSPRRAISNGRIHRDQLEFCERVFSDAPPDASRIVVAHHHFSPAPDYERDQTMPKAKRAMNRFLGLGVELILGGHLHRSYIGNSLDIFPSRHPERGIIVAQCGTTTSRRGRGREREKNTLNLIEIDAHMICITHYMYFEQLGDFAPSSRHIFPRPGRQFVEGQSEGSDSGAPTKPGQAPSHGSILRRSTANPGSQSRFCWGL